MSGKLVVNDKVAEYDGQVAALTDLEEKAVIAIVLRSVAKATRTKLEAVEAQIPKRAYQRKPKEA